MPNCSVYGCVSEKNEKVQTFCLPKSKNLRNKWLEQLNRKNFTPNDKTTRFCIKHFPEYMFVDPSQNLGYRGKPKKKPKLKAHAFPILDMSPPKQPKNSRKTKNSDPAKSDIEISDNISFNIYCANQSVPGIEHDHTYAASKSEPFVDLTSIQKEETVGKPEKCFCSTCKSTIEEKDSEIRNLKKKLEELEVLEKTVSKLFNYDQIDKLKGKNIHNWSSKTLEDALQIYTQCNTSGYNFFRNKGYPLPHLNTVQNHLSLIDCEPGVLTDFFKLMESKVENMAPHERLCGVQIDEMSLQAKIEFDATLGMEIGLPTIPPNEKLRQTRICRINSKRMFDLEQGNDGNIVIDARDKEMAYHGLNCMLVGLCLKWKQPVKFHFTDRSFCPKACARWVKDIIDLTIYIKLIPLLVVTDMSTQNTEVWKEFEVHVSGKIGFAEISNISFYNPDFPVGFMSDATHLDKNWRNALLNNKRLYLPDYFVKHHGLVTNVVEWEVLHRVQKFLKNKELKLAPS